MRPAKELLLSYLENINDADKLIDLFANEATIELPYLCSLGMPWQWHGKADIYKFLQGLPHTFADYVFSNIRIHIETPGQVFGEYNADGTVVATSRPYKQAYMGRLVAENGKIVLIREALDMVEVARSMLPDGVKDLPGK